MIYVGFNIANPWSKRWTNVWNKVYPTPHPNKYIELEVLKDSTILAASFNFTTRQDHAGLTVEVGLLGYSFLFQLYDTRHWNSKEGRWMRYSDELGEEE